MRGGIAVAVLFGALLAAASPAGAGSRPQAASVAAMTVSTTPQNAKAQAVRVRVTLRYEMQCGYPGKGRLRVTFPSSMRLPKRFASGTIRLNRKPIAAMVKGQRVTVAIPPPQGVLCNTIGPGSVTLVFTHAAKLANPVRAGFYEFRATHIGHVFTAKLTIKAAD